MKAIFRKEIADYFSSSRFMIVFLVAVFTSIIAYYSAAEGISLRITGEFIFLRLFTTQIRNWELGFLISFANFTALFFIPLIGISLGFDAINKERTSGTLSRIVSQPVFRDTIINAKFLAGLAVLAVMVTIALFLTVGYGVGLRSVASLLGFQPPIAFPPPGAEELIRLFIYFAFSIIYGAFWMGLAMIFSIASRSTATSLLTSLGLWIFLSIGAVLILWAIGRTTQEVTTLTSVLQVTPAILFADATNTMLFPLGMTTGVFVQNPLSLGQSLLDIWPQLTGLISLTAICFAASYMLFMRQEIRST